MKDIINTLKTEPAAYWMSLAAIISGLIVGFGHPSVTTAAVISGICTACATVLVALLAQRVDVAALSGALAVLVQAVALLTHKHWDAATQAAVVAGINVIVGLVVMRPALTPSVTLRRAKQDRVQAEAKAAL